MEALNLKSEPGTMQGAELCASCGINMLVDDDAEIWTIISSLSHSVKVTLLSNQYRSGECDDEETLVH